MPSIAGPASYPGLHSASLYDGVPLEDCFVCAKHSLGEGAPGGVLLRMNWSMPDTSIGLPNSCRLTGAISLPSPGGMPLAWAISRMERQSAGSVGEPSGVSTEAGGRQAQAGGHRGHSRGTVMGGRAQDYLQGYPDGYTCHFPRPGWVLPRRNDTVDVSGPW